MHHDIRIQPPVNWGAYMEFREATDELFSPISHSDLAAELGVSVPLIRQARLRSDAAAHRQPPRGWRTGVAALAKRRIKILKLLIERIEAEQKRDSRPKSDSR